MSPPAAKPMETRRRVPGFSRTTSTPDAEPAPGTAQPETNAPASPSAETTPRAQPDTPTPAAPQATATDPVKQTSTVARSEQGAKRRSAPEVPGPGGHRHQSNFRLYDSEISYLKRLRREFEDDGIDTDLTELLHALIYASRRGELDPLDTLRQWRRDINSI